jgi:PPK2 family polyphosphate:nucleotide phosphotransferase
MKIPVDDFRVRHGEKLKLAKRPTRTRRYYDSEKQYEKRLADQSKALADMQSLLYAANREALLLIFQAMDAAGKDGVVKHVMSGVNPMGCQVFSFKHPSAEELDHDFLWRSVRALPERGRIGIFNRSYYEEVLIVRVHPAILEAQNLPEQPRKGKKVWDARFRSILDLEEHLHRSGTRILKFFLHLSKEEQRQRFLARIEDPEKQWKFNLADVEERAHWKKYMSAYEACLAATSTRDSPWYVVPADDKPNARLIVSRIITETLAGMDLRYPKPSAKHKRELVEARRRLEKD